MNFSHLLDERWDNTPDTRTLIIEKGTLLFHGTGEDFDPKDLRGGGYDGLLWTTDNSNIAQSYIPKAGASMIAYTNNIISVPQMKNSGKALTNLKKKLGIGAWKNLTYDDRGQLKSFGRSPELDKLLQSLGGEGYYENMKLLSRYFNQKMLEAGYQPYKKSEIDEGEWSWKLLYDENHEIAPPGYRLKGKLFVFEVTEPLKIMDMSTGEGDLMDVQYHRHDMFEKAKQDGFDGIKIDDFAQTEEYGNYGHGSVGLFYKDKIKIKKIIDASHPEEGAFNKPHSKEYAASLAERLIRESRDVLYHQTDVWALMKIIEKDRFLLTFAPKGNANTDYPKWNKYPYFLSTARTKQSRYLQTSGDGSVMLELYGYRLQSKYPIFPYNYWKGFPKTSATLDPKGKHPAQISSSDEAEERLASKNPTIPEVHRYIKSITYGEGMMDKEYQQELEEYCAKYGIELKTFTPKYGGNIYKKHVEQPDSIRKARTERSKKRVFSLKVIYWIVFSKNMEEFNSKFKVPQNAKKAAEDLYWSSFYDLDWMRQHARDIHNKVILQMVHGLNVKFQHMTEDEQHTFFKHKWRKMMDGQ